MTTHSKRQKTNKAVKSVRFSSKHGLEDDTTHDIKLHQAQKAILQMIHKN